MPKVSFHLSQLGVLERVCFLVTSDGRKKRFSLRIVRKGYRQKVDGISGGPCQNPTPAVRISAEVPSQVSLPLTLPAALVLRMSSGRARCTRKLRNWVVEQVESGQFPGVCWDDAAKTMFRIPWKHAGKQDFREDQDAAFFKVKGPGNQPLEGWSRP